LKKINIRPTLVRTHWCAAESHASPLPLSLNWGANSLWAGVPLCSEKKKEKKKALMNDLNPLTKPEIKKGSELSIEIKNHMSFGQTRVNQTFSWFSHHPQSSVFFPISSWSQHGKHPMVSNFDLTD
jgi:hypothetical protein